MELLELKVWDWGMVCPLCGKNVIVLFVGYGDGGIAREGEMSELDDNLAAGIAAKHTLMCERDGGGYHYDSCVRCRLRDDIKEAFRVVREDERRVTVGLCLRGFANYFRMEVADVIKFFPKEFESVLQDAVREP